MQVYVYLVWIFKFYSIVFIMLDILIQINLNNLKNMDTHTFSV